MTCRSYRWTWVLGLIAFLALAFYGVPRLLWAGWPYYYGPGMMMRGYSPWIGGGLWMMFFWLILLGLGLYWLFSVLSNRSPLAPRREIMDILKERYARGEITKEQYEEMKKDLSE